MTGRFLTGGQVQRGPKPWYRLRRYQLPIAAVIIALAFVADRYDTYTPSQRGGQLRSFHSSIRRDLSTCVQGVTVAKQAWEGLNASPIRGSADHAAALAKAAEANCTPVSQDGGVYNLGSLQVPGALKSESSHLSLALYDLDEWAYPHAARALLDLEYLDHHPGDQPTRAALRLTTAAMVKESRGANAIFAGAAKHFHTHVARFYLPLP